MSGTHSFAILGLAFPLVACGGADLSPERAQARFDSTVDWVRDRVEARDGGRLLSGFLSDGTTSAGSPAQHVCGTFLESDGRERAFVARAAEQGTRDLFSTDVANQATHQVWRESCLDPVRDAQGREISLADSEDQGSVSGTMMVGEGR